MRRQGYFRHVCRRGGSLPSPLGWTAGGGRPYAGVSTPAFPTRTLPRRAAFSHGDWTGGAARPYTLRWFVFSKLAAYSW